MNGSNRYVLSKSAKKAMRANGISLKKINMIEAALKPAKVVKLKRGAVSRIEDAIAREGVAVVTRSRVFTWATYKKKVAGGASHLRAYKRGKNEVKVADAPQTVG